MINDQTVHVIIIGTSFGSYPLVPSVRLPGDRATKLYYLLWRIKREWRECRESESHLSLLVLECAFNTIFHCRHHSLCDKHSIIFESDLWTSQPTANVGVKTRRNILFQFKLGNRACDIPNNLSNYRVVSHAIFKSINGRSLSVVGAAEARRQFVV